METVVARPRSTDAIGAALDSAFAARLALPADLAAVVGKLDSIR